MEGGHMTRPIANLSVRLAKLEAVRGALQPRRTVERHIIAETTDAERQARIKAILKASTGNVLHVFRVVTDPVITGSTIQ
jgi:hypothetical protein